MILIRETLNIGDGEAGGYRWSTRDLKRIMNWYAMAFGCGVGVLLMKMHLWLVTKLYDYSEGSTAKLVVFVLVWTLVDEFVGPFATAPTSMRQRSPFPLGLVFLIAASASLKLFGPLNTLYGLAFLLGVLNVYEAEEDYKWILRRHSSQEFQDQIKKDPRLAMHAVRCTIMPFVRFGAAMWCACIGLKSFALQ